MGRSDAAGSEGKPMDPLSLTLSALVSGAAAVLKPTAQQAVKDAYGSLKRYIRHKWAQVDIDALEREPTRKSRQDLVREDLERVQASADRELLEQARALLVIVREHDPEAAATAGIAIEDLDAAANVNIEDLVAHGAIHVRGVKAGQDLNIRGIQAGNPTRR